MNIKQQLAETLLREGLLPVKKASPPGANGKQDRFRAWRWVQKGVRAPDGRQVYLEAVKVGRSWMTSQAAVARFLAATTPAREDTERDADRRASTTRTVEVLERHGLRKTGSEVGS